MRGRIAVSQRSLALGVGGLVVLAFAAWLLWPDDDPKAGAKTPVNNVAGNFRACLLDGPDGTAASRGSRGSAAWDGMTQAAASGRINVQRFPVPTTETKAAMPYVNGVIVQHCDVIVAGDDLAALVGKVAKDNTGQRFLLVGAKADSGNITSVAVNESRPSAVGELVRDRIVQLADG